MKKPFVTVQIYTGGFDIVPENFDVPSIKKKLLKIYQKARIGCVMIGWNPNVALDEITDFLKSHGTELYLWLPVFSGWDGLSPLVSIRGNL